ncbi:MAG: MarR family transcriptional regulator [Sphingomonadaceae bacterium]
MSDIDQEKAGEEAIDGSGDTRRNIALRIGILARMMRNSFDRQVSSLGVTRSQWAMIAVVSSRPGSNQRAIAELLEMSEASAGRLIDRLCTEGLLERRARDDDKRARAVYLTDKAKPMLDSLAEIAAANEQRLFKDFSEDELAMMLDYLDRLHANASKG